jgi:signal peptidase I
MSERIADVDDPRFRHVDDKTARCTFCGHNNLVKKDVSVQSGDEIIVDKTAAPKRWELIAFRVPQRPGAGPSDASEIFVKRLVGMPGETIAISGGDLFVGGMRLQKTPATQPDLWFAAHDTRYVPKTIMETTPRWTRDEESSGWISKGSAWQFDGHDADAGVLRFSGSVTDRYDYNADSSLSMVRPAEEINLVSDVRIRLPIRSLEGSGNLTVRWRHNGRSADATVDAGGDVTLTDGDRSERGTVATPFSPQSPVAFAYRDGLAYVTDGEKVVVKLNVGTTDLLSEKRDRSPVRLEIVGRRCKATIDWITIDRDVYYIDGGTLRRVFGEPTEDDSPRDYTLGADEFFVLGDNSPRSLDSRFYTGPITRDRIVGVARWRYWPPARWREFR